MRRFSANISQQQYRRLRDMAREFGRTKAETLRIILDSHFGLADREKPGKVKK